MNQHHFTTLCPINQRNENLKREICDDNSDSILIDNILCGLKRKKSSDSSKDNFSKKIRKNMQNKNVKEEEENKSNSPKIFDIQQIPQKAPKNNKIIFNNFKVQKVLIKLGSKLTYCFNAVFNKKNLLNLEIIELKGFMNKMQKSIFIQNLKLLNQKYLLKDFLKFNTICAFDEIGEINTQAKKLSALLSMRKIGMQFLLIKNINFQNKILILFYKDSFPFKDYNSANDFYILKIDQDFIKKNFFNEFQNNNNLKQTSLSRSKNILASNMKSLKLRSNLLKKGNNYNNKITSRLINNKFHSIEKRFKDRKIHKIQPFSYSTNEMLNFNSSFQNPNSFDYLKNNLTFNNKIFNYISYYDNTNYNQKLNVGLKSDSDLLIRNYIKDNSFCYNQHSIKFNSKEDAVIKYPSKRYLFRNKIKISLESFEIMDESIFNVTQNQLNFQDYFMAGEEIKPNDDGNYNINYINYYENCSKDINFDNFNRQQQALKKHPKKIETDCEIIESIRPLYCKKQEKNLGFIIKDISFQDNKIKIKIEQPLNLEYKNNYKKCLNCASEFFENYFVDYGCYFLCARCFDRRKNNIKL